ncbi:MAG: protoporphyrinogen oxidase [Deltaproteobacteria bacterium]|nr:protoporphyrinogen oxidase [Deltaproteobacteria bacterium]
MSISKECVVIGGGISGLSSAFFLKRSGRDVALYEKSDRVGGMIHTVTKEGFMLEEGPNAYMGHEGAICEMIDGLDISSQKILAQPLAKNRFIYRRGRIHAVPQNPLKFMISPLLSWSSKCRILMEPFLTKGRGEETIGQFFQKRIGPEATRILIDAWVCGIYAGNIDELSAEACFPRWVALERKHRSLFLGLFKDKSPKRDRTLFSFKSGMSYLPSCMEQWLGKSIFKKHHVLNVEKTKKDHYTVILENEQGELVVETPTLIFATPAYVTAEALQHVDVAIATSLLRIAYAPLCVFHWGFQKGHVLKKLNGFGFLVPRSQRKRTLGVLWNSSLFEQRAPQDHVLLTVMAGGAIDPTAYADELLMNQLYREIKEMLDFQGPPVMTHEKRYLKALPQYRLGHLAMRAKVEDALKQHPGLYIIGNFLDGISTVECIEKGRQCALKAAGL